MEDSQNMPGAPAQQAPQQGGGDQMQQVMQMAQQMLEQGAQPAEVAAQLLGSQVPPEVIMEVFTQMGMAPEEAQATIQEAMQGGQQQQGPGEEQIEGQASNPQEEMMEGAPQGMPQEGGQPSPEEMAMMQEQQGASQPTDEELQMAFGGPAFNLIEKAFGGKADLNVNSASYVQDRQANFINAIKQNALMNQASKQVFQNSPDSMKFGGDLPKADGGLDMSKYKTRGEYLEALYDYNADDKNTTKLDYKTEVGKYKAPVATAINTGQNPQFSNPNINPYGQPRYNIVYNYAPPTNTFGTSSLARLFGNSGREPGQMQINGKNVPAGFNYSDLFDPGKGTGTADGRTWKTTEAEDIRGGLFNRKVVGKKYKINWDPAQGATPTGVVPTATTPGAIPPVTAVVPPVVPAVVAPTTAATSTLTSEIPDDVYVDENIPGMKANSKVMPKKTTTPVTSEEEDYTPTPEEIAENQASLKRNQEAYDKTFGYRRLPVLPKQKTYDSATDLSPEAHNFINRLSSFNNPTTAPTTTIPLKPGETIPVASKPVVEPVVETKDNPRNLTFSMLHFPENKSIVDSPRQEEVVEPDLDEKLKYMQESHGMKSFGGVTSSDLHKAAQTIMMAFGGGLNKFGPGGKTSEELIMERGYSLPEDNPFNAETEVEVMNKKGKLKVDWNAAADVGKQGMDWVTKFANEAEQRRLDKENEGKLSAVNGPRNQLENQGWDQFGNFMGGTDTGAEIQNLTNTSQSMNQQVYSLGGKTYALGGQYDLSDDDVALFKAHGINIQKS
jgi:hypothetical protein